MKRVLAAVLVLLAACSSGEDSKPESRVVRLALGEYKADAVLTLPLGIDKAPAVVMLGGSGPVDADETVASVKPFRDLAEGLARQGVGTLRYTKPVRRAADKQRFTPVDEYEPEARAAVDLLATRIDVDASRIYLLGHSLGGTMAPRIATDEPRFRGVILMAASVEDFAHALLRQTQYLASLGLAPPDVVTQTEAFAREISNPRLTVDTKFTSPLSGGTTGAYFLELRRYKPIAIAKALPRPLLILQGDRDYQVTIADSFDPLTRGLAGKSDVTIVRYPKANHAFVDGEGQPSPAEYAKGGHVDPHVALDIAVWIKAH